MYFVRSFVLTLALIYSFSVLSIAHVNAHMHDSVTDLVTGGGDEGPDINALVDQQSALIKELNSALYHLNTSLERMLRALGLQEAADAAHATAEAVKAGELTGRDEIKKVVAATKEIVPIILSFPWASLASFASFAHPIHISFLTPSTISPSIISIIFIVISF